MPLTKKGKKIMKSMKSQYGAKKGKQVFYASSNKGVIKGVHGSGAFTKSEQDQGYKVMFDASDLHKLSVEHEHMGHMMAKRRISMHKEMM